ncbi:MAG: RloB family protein [Muribaculaceae bacterium]|nr:RloB family protein [Muribaculaceae bacterium]
MARIVKKRYSKQSVAIIVDGNDEKWYIDNVKKHYSCNAIRSMKIKPDLPQRKKVQELFNLAESKLNEEYTFVILIIDLDEPLKDVSEYSKFKYLYSKYLLAKNNELTGRQNSKYGWMSKILIIINNPCLEYWYLLHFNKITRFYADYQSLLPELKKIPILSQYDKCEDYYNKKPNIYERLENALNVARNNAIQFNLDDCNSQGCSEMNLLFDYFDKL